MLVKAPIYSPVISRGTGSGPAPVVGPVLSNLGQSSLETDTGNGFVRYSYSPGPVPSKAQLFAKQNHNSTHINSQDVNVSATGLVTLTPPVLDARQWNIYAAQEDSEGVQGSVYQGSFTIPDEDVYNAQIANNGTWPGSASNLVVADGQADSKGGSNAVLISNDGLGTLSNQLSASLTYPQGLARIRLKIKDIAKSSAERWVRVRPLNVSQTPAVSFNITNDSTPDDQRDGASATAENCKVTGIGDGWFILQFDVDFTGASDVVGNITISMSDRDNNQTIPDNSTAGTDQIAVHEVQIWQEDNTALALAGETSVLQLGETSAMRLGGI